jgi:speckle-type POZ protein
MATSKTLSTSAPETEQCTHVFRIVGYSQQTGLGKPIRSGMFYVGGHEWVAFLYPPGAKFSIGIDEHHVAAGVVMMGPKNSKARASCELRLINQRTGMPFSVHKVAPREFNHDSSHSRSAQVFFAQPDTPNRSTPVPVNRTGLTGYR